MRVTGILWLIVKRTVNRLPLLSATLAGLVTTVALITSVPLYSEGVSESLLRRTLASANGGRAYLLVQYTGSDRLPFTVEKYHRVTRDMLDRGVPLVGLPMLETLWSGQTLTIQAQIRGADDPEQLTDTPPIGLAFRQGLLDHVEALEGALPTEDASAGGEILATTNVDLADANGLHVGDRYVANVGTRDEPHLVDVRLVGLWVPRDPDGPYWKFADSTYAGPPMLFVDEKAFVEGLLPTLPSASLGLRWRIELDPRALSSANAVRVVDGLDAAQTRLAIDFPEGKPTFTFAEALKAYVQRAGSLETLLLVLAVPILAVLLYYEAMTAAMVVEQEAGEIALLKGRGASHLQVFGVYAVEGLLVAAFITLLGPLVATVLAQAFGHAYSFLLFAVNKDPLPVRLVPHVFGRAAEASALAISATLVPAVGAARRSIIVQRQSLGRPAPAALWTLPFELMPLAISLYGYYTFQQRQTILEVWKPNELVPDPLLVVVPAVFIFGLALVCRRLLPLAIRLAAWVAGRFGGPSIGLALRQLSRAPGHHFRLALLLTLTLPLGMFGASAARTIDHNYDERVRYQVGSDVFITEYHFYDEAAKEWQLQEFDDHRTLPGVASVARVCRFDGSLPVPVGPKKTTVIGVDPADLARTAFFRRDFAAQSLGELTNRLLGAEHAALVSRHVVAGGRLRLGDEITVRVEGEQVPLVVVGVLDYFPTVYPDDEAFVVANLDYIYGQIGPRPYEVWIRTAPGASGASIMAALQDRGLRVSQMIDSRSVEAKARGDASRVGLLGMLTLGFLVAALLTVGGFAYYGFLSFRERLLQFGLLRAMGLSFRQLLVLLVAEQAVLIVAGLAAGTAIGALTSYLFVPFLQLSSEAHAGIPPFSIIYPWSDIARIYATIGLTMLLAIPPTALALSRLQIYRAIKLGES